MRRLASTLAMTIALFGLSTAAYAQCGALLKDGVYDYRKARSDDEVVRSFISWMQDRRSDATGTTGGISIPVIGSLNADQWTRMQQDIQNYSRNDSASRSRLLETSKTVSDSLVRAFKDCMASKGVHAWIETAPESDRFTLAVTFNSPGEPPVATVRNLTVLPSTVQCEDVIRQGTQINGGEIRAQCTRGDQREVTITLNPSVGGVETLRLPAVRPLPPVNEQRCNTVQLISRNATVSASATAGSASRITDGSSGSVGWNSGAMAPQWIEIDLGRAEWIRRISLTPIQSPSGETIHQIVGVRASGEQVILDQTPRSTRDLSTFEVAIDPGKGKDFSRIRINTTKSPSWVAWSEIEVWACR
jgi:hypothetical protein